MPARPAGGGPSAVPADLRPYDGVLLVSFGGPERPEDVLPFLQSVAAGRGIPPERLAAVEQHYQARGGRSPINDETRALLTALDAELAARGLDVPLLWGNRHAAPFVDDALAEAAQRGAHRLVAVTTSAYSSYSSCRSYLDAIERAAAQAGEIRVDTIRPYAHHPGFSRTVADLALEGVRALPEASQPAHLVFVAHSIPEQMDRLSGPPEDSGRYRRQHEDLARAVAERVGASVGHTLDWTMAYCSRSGPPGQPWLEPDINNHLHVLAEQGVAQVVLIPFGFVADHLEVVHDLDQEASETARRVGLQMVRVPTVRNHPRFVAGLVDLVLERAALSRGEVVEQPTWPAGSALPVPCPSDCCRRPPGRPSGPGAGR